MDHRLAIESPLGTLRLHSDGRALTGVFMGAEAEERSAAASTAIVPTLQAAAEQLQEYFAGVRRQFDLPLDAGGTEFQRQVWQALLEIPFGVTWSYGELARHIGRPGASRAVGLANGANPISIVIPCHRVIGANGSLTGYGGGIERKRWLLRHELGADFTLR
jgi:methylated-DNA-[protein]-cysteine S-methyltransferase